MSSFSPLKCSDVAILGEKLANLSSKERAWLFERSAWEFSIPSFISGVLGNALALLVLVASWKKQHKTVFYKLIFALIFVDLMGQVRTGKGRWG